MPTLREKAFAAINSEREYQDEKFQSEKTVTEEALLLEHYVTKLRTAIVHSTECSWMTAEAVREIAGIATRALETIISSVGGDVPLRVAGLKTTDFIQPTEMDDEIPF